MAQYWRSQEFITKIKNELSVNQYKRFNKIYNEEFYLIDTVIINNSNIPKFKICGSTQNIYTISYNTDKNNFWCDCPDMKIHCGKQNCVCKHVCFMLVRVLKHYDLQYYIDRNFTNDEITIVKNKLIALNNMPTDDDQITNTSLIEKYKNNLNNFSIKKDTPDEDCSICYDLLMSTDLLGCPCCKNSFHKKCIETWLARPFAKTCVYCRSDCWKNYGSAYISI